MVDIARDPLGPHRRGRRRRSTPRRCDGGACVRSSEQGVLACAKRFAAYGAARRRDAAANLSEAMLREVYLPPFQAAVDAGVATFMSSFNTINGVPATANRWLLTDVLRSEWGFRGFVVSDWAAIEQLLPHGIAASRKDAATKAIHAGVDMAMWDGTYTELEASPAIDEAVRRVLRAKFAAGLFENPFADESRAIPLARGARRVARASIVLLKNNNALLPLAKNKKLAIVGALAESKEDMLGAWASVGKPEEAVSVHDGMRTAGAKLVSQNEADVIVAVLGETREMSAKPRRAHRSICRSRRSSRRPSPPASRSCSWSCPGVRSRSHGPRRTSPRSCRRGTSAPKAGTRSRTSSSAPSIRAASCR
jgi:beta-glucosidase